MSFKIGDKIVPKSGQWRCAVAHYEEADYALITHMGGGMSGTWYGYDLYKDGEIIDFCYHCLNDTNSKLMEKTMDDLQVGDVLVTRYGSEKAVLEVLANVVLLSITDRPDTSDAWYTFAELEERCFTLKNNEKTTEITLDEVAEKFGVDVDKLKIKKGE